MDIAVFVDKKTHIVIDTMPYFGSGTITPMVEYYVVISKCDVEIGSNLSGIIESLRSGDSCKYSVDGCCSEPWGEM